MLKKNNEVLSANRFVLFDVDRWSFNKNAREWSKGTYMSNAHFLILALLCCVWRLKNVIY